MKKALVRVAPFLIAGPITGPFLAGVYYNWREGRRFLAGLYALAVVEALILAPLFAAQLADKLGFNLTP